ncbi:MAG: glutamate ligase domain-containing protein, partial [Acidimicrobiales bacterium]
DTYNANPAGAAAALEALARHGSAGRRRVVVTPGMVELGPRQHEENARFAAAAAAVATHLVVVGHTNRRALLEGAAGGGARVVPVETRDQAVAWVRGHVGEGDAVLYENDLPDHYP